MKDFDFEESKKYLKYLVIIIPIILALLLIKSCGTKSYSKLEGKIKESVLNYIEENNMLIIGEKYIELSELPEIEGTELCNSSSGAIVKNNNGKLEITVYLNCPNYESKIVENKEKYIELNGSNVVVLNKGEVFDDPLYNLKKDVAIEVDGEVGTNPGVYTISYKVYADNKLAEILYRKVLVVNDKNATISGINDKLNPNLYLKGDQYMVIRLGERYVEPGYWAIDYKDGKISRNVRVEGKVNTKSPGEYKLTYIVENTAKRVAQVTRTIEVVRQKANLTINLVRKNTGISNKATLELTVIGNEYLETELPNGVKISDRVVTYNATKNTDYRFVVYDAYGNSYPKTIEVNGIDNIIPVGSCKAVVTAGTTSVTVDAKDENGIAGYSYILNKKSTDFMTTSSYSVNKSAKNVSVIVKDIANNNATINCEVEERLNDPNGIRVTLSGAPRLQIPIADALARKGYTVNDLNQCIFSRVKEAGVGTRYGVVAAAYGLIDCTRAMTGYVLSYDHTGGKVHVDSDGANYCTFNSDICGKIGVNTRWGAAGGTCRSEKCYYGLNCATFVRWSMCNGGMDLCDRGTAGAFSMANKDYFPEADGVVINKNSVKYYSGKDLTNYTSAELVRMLQPGDIAARERNGDENGSSQHTFVIIGRDETGIYTANDGYYINKISYSSMVDGEYYYRLLFLDNYYANLSNRNNLYN